MTATRTTKPRPDDQPFDFNLDEVKPDGDLSPFVCHWNGRRWTFTHVQDLDCWDLIESAQGGEVQVILGTFKLALGDQYDDFRKIPMPQYKLMPLFRAWLKHCGVDEDGTPLAAG